MDCRVEPEKDREGDRTMRAENLDSHSLLKTPPNCMDATWQDSCIHPVFPLLPLLEGRLPWYSCLHNRISSNTAGSSNKAMPPFPTRSQLYCLESHTRKCNLLIVNSTVSGVVKMLNPLQPEPPSWVYFTCPFALSSAANVLLWNRTHSLPTSF